MCNFGFVKSLAKIMKKLGLVGGMGPQSTVPYYMGVVYGVRERTSPLFFPNLTIESVNVFEILDLIGRGRVDEVADQMLRAIGCLHAAGCEFAALTANTAHIVFDQVAAASPIPLVSIIEATAAEAKRRGLTKLGLLGTRFTMEGEFYRKPFERQGIEIVTPIEAEKVYVDHTITSELELGIVKPETLERYRRIVSDLGSAQGAQAVILGCTELPLLLNDEVSPLPVLDTVKIHTAALVDAVLS